MTRSAGARENLRAGQRYEERVAPEATAIVATTVAIVPYNVPSSRCTAETSTPEPAGSL